METAYDRSANFKVYQTFNWYPTEVPPPTAGAEGLPYNSALDLRIREAIASELVKQGLSPTTLDPGLLVAYDIAVDLQQEPASNYVFPPGFGYGYSYWYGYRYNYGDGGIPEFRNIREYRAGTLVIDLIDRNTNQLIWRGWSESVLDPATAVDSRKINRIIANIMSRFPPTPDITR
ncbi:DUF4136 domain-containing protein [Pontibacter sp. MBLB2868]|uniref:DUF4136 domain-containing protein n=1 Tax=Pontibacter sp. MBLB2868 TaxID=3451555 RepID=UPI003F74DFF9